MGIKLTVLLMNKIGPFHWSCQHVAAIATDIQTGRTFNVNWVSARMPETDFHWASKLPDRTDKRFYNCYVYLHEEKGLFYIDYHGNYDEIHLDNYAKFEEGAIKMKSQRYCSIKDVETFITANGGHVPLSKSFITRGAQEYNELLDYADHNRCWIGKTSLFSDLDFDEFVNEMKSEFSDSHGYSFFSNNCADAVAFAIDLLCPKKACTEVAFWIYQAVSFPFFVGSLGLSCCPAPPCFCTTPQDIFKKAQWLANFTSYGVEASSNVKNYGAVSSADDDKFLTSENNLAPR